MSNDEKKGKLRLLVLLGMMVAIDLATMLYYVLLLGVPDRLMGQLVRLLLMLVFMYFTYDGKQWAKTILSVLLGLGILRGFLSIYQSLGNIDDLIQVSILTVFYIIIFYLINWGKFIKKFLDYQKSRTGLT